MARNRQRTSGVLALLFFALAAAMLVVMCGCFGVEYWAPTSPLDWTPRQLEISHIIARRCNQLGVSPKINFTDDKYIISYEGQIHGYAAMWTFGDKDEIWVWNEILDYSNERIDAYAKHECCHAYLDHTKASFGVEAAADTCAREMYED